MPSVQIFAVCTLKDPCVWQTFKKKVLTQQLLRGTKCFAVLLSSLMEALMYMHQYALRDPRTNLGELKMLEQGCKLLLVVRFIMEVEFHRQVPSHLLGQPAKLEGWKCLLHAPDEELSRQESAKNRTAISSFSCSPFSPFKFFSTLALTPLPSLPPLLTLPHSFLPHLYPPSYCSFIPFPSSHSSPYIQPTLPDVKKKKTHINGVHVHIRIPSDVRTLYLYGHNPSILQDALVALSQRGCPQRLLFKARKEHLS